MIMIGFRRIGTIAPLHPIFAAGQEKIQLTIPGKTKQALCEPYLGRTTRGESVLTLLTHSLSRGLVPRWLRRR